MATLYVRSTDGSDSDNGTTWALAKATIAGAFAIAAAGDTVYVSDNHAESQGSAMTLTSPGTAVNPVRLICGNDAAEPPTASATTATVTTTGANAINFAGFAYCYGITFSGATTGSATNPIAMAPTTTFGWVFDSCKLIIGGTNAASRMLFGAAAGSTLDDQFVRLINTTVKFGATSQAIQPGAARVEWMATATAIDTGGSVPSSLFIPLATSVGTVECSGVDFSAIDTGNNLVSVATANIAAIIFYFRNCKLGSGFSVMTGTIGGHGGARIFLDNCDSGDTNYRMRHYKHQGSVFEETTIVRTSGASDGTTPISHAMASLASGPTLFAPLEGPWIPLWNEDTGSSKTATVEIIHDSVTALKDNEVWLEVEYLGTSGFPISSYARDRVADHFTTAANQASSSATWTTTGLTNPNKQKLEVTFTPQEKGLIRARVCLAKTDYIVYVDPVMDLGSGIGRRQYLVPGALFLNEAADEGGGGGGGPIFGGMVVR